jgi:AraC-like DNA-binding protein
VVDKKALMIPGIERNPQSLAVSKAKKLLTDPATTWTVKALAKEVGLTESHFCRVFKKVTGMRVSEYRTSVRDSNAAMRKESDGRMEERSEVVIPELAWDMNIIAPESKMDVFDFAAYEDSLHMTASLDVSLEQSEGDCFEFLDFELETDILEDI